MEEQKTQFYQRLTAQTDQRMTPSDQRIIDHLLRTYPNCIMKNASEIAKELKVNVSTVTRFFQKIGYKSIREAQSEFKADFEFISSPLDRHRQGMPETDLENIYNKAYEADLLNLKNTFAGLRQNDLDELIELLAGKPKKITIVSEKSKTLALAYYFYSQLRFLLPDVQLLEFDKISVAQSLADVKPGDCLIVFSFRRYIQLHRQIVKLVKQAKGKVVAITDSPLSPIAKKADIVLLAETNSVSPFDSYTAGFALLNMLTGKLSQKCSKSLSEKYEKVDQIFEELKTF